MVFSSIVFVFYFLPVFLVGYYVGGCRIGLLLLGSAAFYVWGEGPYILLLAALIGLNYTAALVVSQARDPARRRGFVIGLAAIDLGVLGLFKYAGFVAHQLNALLPGAPIPEFHPALPLGISFFTSTCAAWRWRRSFRASPPTS